MTRPFLSSFLLQTALNVQITLNKDKKTFFMVEVCSEIGIILTY